MRKVWPKFGWQRRLTRVDPVQMASPLDAVDNCLLDAYGGVHAVLETQAPATDVYSAAQLNDLQDRLVAMLTRVPESVSEMEWLFTANRDYRPVINQHARLAHGNRVLDDLKATRVARLGAEVSAGILVGVVTHVVLGVGTTVTRKDAVLRRPVCSASEFRTAQRELDAAERFVAGEMERLGIGCRRLRTEEAADLFYRIASPHQAITLGIPLRYDREQTPWLDTWLIEEMQAMAPEDAGGVAGLVRWGDTFHAVVTLMGKPLESWPRVVESVTAALPFRQLRFSLRVRRLDQMREKDLLAKKRAKADQMLNMPLNMLDRVLNPYAKDRASGELNIEAQDQIAEANELISALRSGGETLVAAQAVWHLWHTDPAELGRRRDTLLSRLADLGGARGYAERDGVVLALLYSMPGAGGEMIEPKKYRSRMLADMIPLNRGFETGDRPVALLRNATGGMVPLDLFDTTAVTAPMAFVSGKTGSGKSVAVNHLVMSHALEGSQVMIVDFGGSYTALAEALGVPVFEVKDARTLNVFQLFGVPPAGQEYTQAQRSRITTCVEALCTQPGDAEGQLPLALRELLDQAVEQTLALSRQPSVQQRAAGGIPTLSDLASRLRQIGDAAPLLQRLRPYLRGELYGRWFDGPMEWNPSRDAFVLDLAQVRQFPDLARGLVPLAVTLIHDLVGADPARPKVLVFEEIWEHVSNPRVLDMIITAFKTFRKQGAAVIGVSQSLADLEENARASRAILQSAQTVFLFEQGDQTNRDFCAAELRLTSGEQEILRSLAAGREMDDEGKPVLFRECLMVRGTGEKRQSGRVRFALMPEEYWLYSSSPKERALRAQAISAAQGDVATALRALARQHPLGLRDVAS